MLGYRYTHKLPTYTHIYTFEEGFDTNPMNRVSGAPATGLVKQETYLMLRRRL